MSKETELKLRAHPNDVPSLVALLNSLARSEGHSTLKNRYLDTPQAALAGARAALRIREQNGGWEQTLKTRGQSIGGLQQRGEWNWPLSADAVDLSLLQSAEVQAHWPAGVQAGQLTEVFRTDFDRQSWVWQQGDTQIEIVIDTGTVSAGTAQVPLCEVELELRQGDEQPLWSLALQLAAQVPLWLSDISKAERGYRLAGLGRSGTDAVSFSRQDDLAQVLPRWLNHELQLFRRALEAALWDDERPAALRALRHGQALRQLPQLAGKVYRRRDTRALREALDVCLPLLLPLAAAAQLESYLSSADDPAQTSAELKALRAQWQQGRERCLQDTALAQALIALGQALHALPVAETGHESAAHWLRHLLQQQAPLLQRLHDQRPQLAEQWRGRQHDMALLCQSCDYLRGLPELAHGLGINGGGIGEGSLRVLADMLNAQTLLQRPWPLAPLCDRDGQDLRPAEEYSHWAEEHLVQLARQL